MFPDANDLTLLVTDEAFYPNKEMIEQSYGSGSKLSSEDGGKNIFDIYWLEDHGGNEITISELVDRYLFNPELCFKPSWPQMKSFDIIKDETELEPEADKNSTIEPNPKNDFMTCHDCGEVIPLFYVKIHQCEKKVYNNQNLTYARQVLINHLHRIR